MVNDNFASGLAHLPPQRFVRHEAAERIGKRSAVLRRNEQPREVALHGFLDGTNGR